MSRLFHQLPEPHANEDHAAYFMRLRSELADQSLPLMELMEACREKIRARDFKLKQVAAAKLVDRIVQGEDLLVVREALVFLLKDQYAL